MRSNKHATTGENGVDERHEMNPRKRHQLSLTRTLAVLDSEWTSVRAQSTRMITLTIILLRSDGSAEELSWMFNPETPIDPGAQEVHGITREMVQDKPPFREHAHEIDKHLENCDIGGYAVINDLMVLEHEMRRAGLGFTLEHRNLVDAYRLWTVREPRKLANAYQRFVGELPDDAKLHDACDDTRLTVDVIETVLGEGTVSNAHEEAMSGVVDLGRRFRRNENDIIVFAFGEHMEKPAIHHPDYLRWMLGKDFPEDTKRICRYLIGRHKEASTIAARKRRMQAARPREYRKPPPAAAPRTGSQPEAGQ